DPVLKRVQLAALGSGELQAEAVLGRLDEHRHLVAVVLSSVMEAVDGRPDGAPEGDSACDLLCERHQDFDGAPPRSVVVSLPPSTARSCRAASRFSSRTTSPFELVSAANSAAFRSSSRMNAALTPSVRATNRSISSTSSSSPSA